MARIIQIGPGGGAPSNPARGPQDAPERRVIDPIETTMRLRTVEAEQGSGAASVILARDERRAKGLVVNQSGATVWLGTAASDDAEWLPVPDNATYIHESRSVLLGVFGAGGSSLAVNTVEDRY